MIYEVDDQFRAPDPTDFFAVPANKAKLLNYLCDKWSLDEIKNLRLGSKKL